MLTPILEVQCLFQADQFVDGQQIGFAHCRVGASKVSLQIHPFNDTKILESYSLCTE